MGKILLYENTAIYFLRQVISNLKKWKKLPHEQLIQQNKYKQALNELFDDVLEELPNYCLGVMGLLNTILYENNSWEEKKNLMNKTIQICDILLQNASVQSFEFLVDLNYSTLMSDQRFSEDILEDIFERAWKLQLLYEAKLRYAETSEKQREYKNKLKENSILWIALTRMQTISEELLLKVIKYAHFDSWHFYCFCIEVARNLKTTEKVWLKLIKRISKEKFNNFSFEKECARKTRIIVTMLQIKFPGLNVAKQIWKVIKPTGKYCYDYYTFFLLKCRNDKEMMQEIASKMSNESSVLCGGTNHSKKRLLLVLNNLSS